MQNKILISVIIPNYNRADTVGQTIESIVAQKVNADVEVVIGDDCSTDNARDVLLKYKELYPDVIRLIFHEQNIGLGANWATCVKACCGKYICNCDNDDFWHNERKLQLQLDYMETHPNSNVLFTDYRNMYRDTGVIIDKTTYISDKRALQDVIWGDKQTVISNATVMYRAKFLKKHINLDEWIQWKPSLQDWNAWVILAAYTDFDILHESTATICLENTSITRAETVEKLSQRYAKDKDMCRYLGMLFPNKFPFDEDEWNRYVAGRLVKKAFHNNDWENANKYSKQNPTGVSMLRLLCAKNLTIFNLYCFTKKMFNKMRQISLYANKHKV